LKRPWKNLGAWTWVPLGLMAGVLLYASLAGRALEVGKGRGATVLSGPPRLVENGPYVRDLLMSWSEEGADLTLKASRLSFVKTKFMGMDNALMKKMRLDDVVVEVMHGDQRVLCMTKDRIEGAPSGKRFVLDSPTILFPKGARQPDKAVIHKERREIVFWYGGESRTLDFAEAESSGSNPFGVGGTVCANSQL